MENASKALLIAAAVLIVILIITFGIRIFNSTSDTQQSAIKTGETISDKIQLAKESVDSQITDKLPLTEENIKTQIQSAYQEYKNSSNVSGEMQNKLQLVFKDKSIVVSEKNEKIIVSSKINGEVKKYVYNKNTNTFSEYINVINYGKKTKETVAPGDDITIETEKFKVFSVDNGKIKAMPYYNLLLKETPIRQATKSKANNAGGSEFSTTNYWTNGEDAIDMSDSRNLIQKYIVAYKKTLEDLGAEGIQVRVARYSDLSVKGITNEMRNPGKTSWFWIGSSNKYGGNTVLWYIDSKRGKFFRCKL